MKKILLPFLLFAALTLSAQQRNPVVPSFEGVTEDFKPNITNQLGRQYPMVNSQGAVRARLRAPQATAVRLDIGGRKYEMTKDAEGFQKTNKVVFMSCGSKENPRVMEAAENLQKIGINAVGYVSEGTAHEWHTWRRSLYQFAQLLFK